ncbi:hypothetical protein [Rhizobium sullae]|uniref:hypothetical protein n=1 Tax=Rhizobium sullae TaxID=50338 RepID=UPI0014042C83|nr:hypothetical protein [Rhizobium sullae]
MKDLIFVCLSIAGEVLFYDALRDSMYARSHEARDNIAIRKQLKQNGVSDTAKDA